MGTCPIDEPVPENCAGPRVLNEIFGFAISSDWLIRHALEKNKLGPLFVRRVKKKQEKREELKVSVLKQPTPKDIVTKWGNWRASDWWWYNGDNALSLLTVYACYVPLSLSAKAPFTLYIFSFFLRASAFYFLVYIPFDCVVGWRSIRVFCRTTNDVYGRLHNVPSYCIRNI